MSKQSARLAKPGTPRSKREEVRARRRRRQVVERAIGVVVILALVLGSVAIYLNSRVPPALPGEQTIPDEGAGHVEAGTPITYNHYPPSSGTHYDTEAEWGVYTTEIAEGYWVHNLEHGGIVVLYNCPPEGCADLEADLAEVARSVPEDSQFGLQKILVTPYSRELPSRVVLLAWAVQLDLDSVDREAIINFYRRHVNKGPELAP